MICAVVTDTELSVTTYTYAWKGENKNGKQKSITTWHNL